MLCSLSVNTSTGLVLTFRQAQCKHFNKLNANKMKLCKKIVSCRNDIALALAIVALAVAAVLMRDQFGILRNREAFQDFIYSFGILGPLVIILVIIVEVIIAPIPGFVPAVSAGFIFGTIEGAIYVYIGNIIGSSLVFLIARKYGKMLLLKFISEQRLAKYEHLIANYQNLLLLLYVFPFVPVDILSGAFGLSAIRFKKYLTYIAIAFVAHVLLLNYLGDYLARLYFGL